MKTYTTWREVGKRSNAGSLKKTHTPQGVDAASIYIRIISIDVRKAFVTLTHFPRCVGAMQPCGSEAINSPRAGLRIEGESELSHVIQRQNTANIREMVDSGSLQKRADTTLLLLQLFVHIFSTKCCQLLPRQMWRISRYDAYGIYASLVRQTQSFSGYFPSRKVCWFAAGGWAKCVLVYSVISATAANWSNLFSSWLVPHIAGERFENIMRKGIKGRGL